MKTTTILTVVMLAKREAAAINKEIKAAVAEIDARAESILPLILEMHSRQGYIALGYKGWTEYVETEIGVSRRHSYRLLNQAVIVDQLGAFIPEAHARLLGDIPNADRPGIYAAAQSAAREEGKSVTTGHVKAAIDSLPELPESTNAGGTTESTETHEAGTSSNAGTGSGGGGGGGGAPSKTIGEQAETNEKLRTALDYLGKVCGKKLREALEDGTVPMKAAEVIRWAGEADVKIIEIEPLITVNRWPLSQAFDLLNTMPKPEHRIERLIWLALANIDGEWSGTIDGVDITAKLRKRR